MFRHLFDGFAHMMLLSGGDDSFQHLLNRTFNANYNPKTIQREEERPEESITAPFQFYDHHIGSNYTLKNVVHLPSIPHLLSKTCDLAIMDFLTNGHEFSASQYYFEVDIPRVEFMNARTVGRYYATHIAILSRVYLSKLCVHPHVESWPSIFDFMQDYKNETLYMTECHLTVAEDTSGGIFEAE
ncbi:hypothetical protein CVT25_012424 [Psilocybe cyanescens]|uniref:Uncharacterized protein n=1 Tax=Psilocybe cyanescens TaxID=93625 RepID=A0A409W6S8_PSICY|nr:hypothetical protein CVT25_012424 [Psilocybe cyanescens]